MLILLSACVLTPAVAQVGSATVEDIVRVLREDQLRQKVKELENTPFTGFFYIAAYGKKADVVKALKAGADPNAGDPQHGGTPPLTLAAGINPDSGVIDALIAAGADVNHKGQTFGRTALHQAVLFNPNAKIIIRALLKGKPDLYVLDRYNKVPLEYAIAGTFKNEIFDGKPREDLMIELLNASAKLPYTLSRPDQQTFFTWKLRRYNSNKNDKPDKKVLAAFEKAGADMSAIRSR